MSGWDRPGGGDSEIAAPADEAGASTAVVERVAVSDEVVDHEPLNTTASDTRAAGSRLRARPSNVVLLLSVILVAVIAQAVISYLSFDVTRQLRDQTVSANGLQRCIISAQLNATSTTAANSGVRSCLSK
ncbi:MAG: hypothetical protein ABI352_05935 [Candidatus Dormibacter sp.]